MKGRNEEVLKGLLAAEAEGRMHHAYLLSGPESPAKRHCAERLLARMSGRNGEQAVLERIQRGNHPDLVSVMPEGSWISVEEIRALPKILAYPPLEAKKRIVILEQAQKLNVQSSNAFLKILEEPPPHTLFFLLCRDPSELLPTILSRCQVMRFSPLEDSELLSYLGETEDSGKDALLAWSGGSLERARTLAGTEGGTGIFREACAKLLELWESSPRIPSDSFRWVEELEAESEEIVLGSWELLLRDLAFSASGAGAGEMYFPEFHSRLSALAAEGVIEEAGARSAAINRFRVYRRLNGNLRLDFASLLAELQIFSVGKRD